MIAMLWLIPYFLAVAVVCIGWILLLGKEIKALAKASGRQMIEASRLGYVLIVQMTMLVGLFVSVSKLGMENPASLIFLAVEILASLAAIVFLNRLQSRLGRFR